MKKILMTLFLLLPLAVAAQNSTQGGARVSVGIDWKIRKGLHLKVSEEMRTEDVFKNLSRFQTTVGLDYKPIKWMKLGVGYVLINPYDAVNMNFKSARHRFYLEAQGHYDVGGFRFSLRERGQFTHRGGTFNVYQNTPNAFALKTRLGVEYKDWRYFEPGVFLEIRTQLNGPWGTTSGSMQVKNDGTTYYDYTPAGYTHVYNDRYRLIFRTDIKLNKHHILRPYAYIDYVSKYLIDTNSEGTRLFSAEYSDYFKVSVGINYTFKF
jgi:hypothetical protein